MTGSPVHEFFLAVRRAHSSGSATEPSYYPALEALLTAVGQPHKPSVRALMSLKSLGAGFPDGGLFTEDQFPRSTTGRDTQPPQNPGRGAIEVKTPAEELDITLESRQVRDYAKRYGTVLVTNLRDWGLVEWRDGGVHVLSRLTLASTEEEFWRAQPKKLSERHGRRLEAFIDRAVLHRAPLATPEDLARVLAVYAREGLIRAEEATKDTGLEAIRQAFSEALGVDVRGERGEHFFRSSLIQTLFYGAFSAWIVWSHEHLPASNESFDWRSADWLLKQRAITALYNHIARPGPMHDLNLVEVLDWVNDALNRVDRDVFFERFAEKDAVQYFYEPFLAAFDPVLRKSLGVWYTPSEIVTYMVERVDHVLRTELGKELGFADPSVFVLDPCCGTGSYLVEVLRRIERTAREQGHGALAAQQVREAAVTRVAGFEIMPAPFVVAHMQVALFLQSLGTELAESERAAIYLTNALTGWDAPDAERDQQMQLHLSSFNELFAERDEARKMKRDRPILVVIGNPPYSAFAGVSSADDQDLGPYKEGLAETWETKKYNLDELYVRFFRVAERRIAEQTGFGVVCYISNSSYLGRQSFVVMRQHLAESFESIWIDNLNGDKRETGKRTPEGLPDPSVFSTPLNKPGIELGTAIGLFVRKPSGRQPVSVRYRSMWGVSKREDLLASLDDEHLDRQYDAVHPDARSRYSFRPASISDEWQRWPSLPDLAAFKSNGLMEKRRGALIDVDRDTLEARMRAYFDPAVSWEELQGINPGLGADAGRSPCSDDLEEAPRHQFRRTGDSALCRPTLRHALVLRHYVEADLERTPP